jgi:hypothetical protein
MTKKQLLQRINILETAKVALDGIVKNREDRLVEHSNEIVRMQGILDNIEAVNRDLHIKLNVHQTKINHLTSATKSLIAVL